MKNKLFFATLISYLGIYITMPVLSAISTKAHMLPNQIGIMISLGAFAMLIFAPIWGKLSDKWGRKTVIVTGLLGMAIGFVFYTIFFKLAISSEKAVNFLIYGLMLVRFIMGMFMTTAPTAANAYMADISTVENRAKDMASLGAATGLAMVLGPIIGGLLSSSGNLFNPFYVTSIMLAVFGILLIFWLPKGNKSNSSENLSQKNTVKTNKKFFTVSLFGWLLVGCSIMFIVVGLQLLTSLYIKDVLVQTVAQSAKTASLLFVVQGVMLMLTQVVQINILNWHAKKMMLVGVPILVAGLLLLTAQSSFALIIVSYVLIGIGAGLGISSLSAGASLTVSQEHQGSVAGAVAMTQGIAGIVSPLFGTSLFQINIRLPFYVFALFCCFSYIVFIFLTKTKKEQHS
ncbi:MFS transporter [Vagococcus entomophilus]|uniref:MFS transporter n=1 Tax=Vagococcus entomophilus TaxID=1160095 RepID=A0A430AFG4_9ENTE|nr:MFS transporter [Vagococcus entomophilus]RSU06461.1 MFS transporter [Vagococcus entomophilus]